MTPVDHTSAQLLQEIVEVTVAVPFQMMSVFCSIMGGSSVLMVQTG
jgi:hypothetical protein